MQIFDQHNRIHDYLRISLTDNCNFRCRYCMPDDEYSFLPQPQLLQPDEIEHLANIFVQLGVTKIRLTGGEPLVRKEAGTIISRLSQLPVSLTLTTNGALLQQYIPLLKQSGVTSINISLDSLQSDKFRILTKRDYFNKVWDAIHVALNEGFHVKINVVVMHDINDNEILDFVEWTKLVPVHVRFIEFMPFTGNNWMSENVFTWQNILAVIQSKYDCLKLKDEAHVTSKKYIVPGHVGTFSVISTITSPFCSSCNRMRLTADGKMKNCLFSKGETDLLTPLRNGEDVKPLIIQNIFEKAAERGGQFIDNFEQLHPEEIKNRSMITIGG